MADDLFAPPSQPGQEYPWWQVWLQVYTRPNVEAYQDLLRDPHATTGRAYIWTFISSTIALIVLVLYIALSGFPEIPGYEQYNSYLGYFLIALICGSPILGLFGILSLMISAGLMHLVAKVQVGEGRFAELVYLFSAISSPLALLSSILLFLPFFNLISLPFSLYSNFLYILAIKAANRFGWGNACLTYISIPILVIILSCCLAFAFASRIQDLNPYQSTLFPILTPFP